MKSEEMLKAVVRTFGDVRTGGDASDQALQALDRGMVTVALLLAAIDGTILPAEHEAFKTLVRLCRGGSAQDPHEFFREEFQSVATLTAMGQTDEFSKKERLDYFVEAAIKALPSGFVNGTFADVRRAFVLWVAMGVSDGEFSDIEKAALEKLSTSYARVRPALGKSKKASGELGLLESDFLDRAESAIRGLTVPAKQAKAAEDLVALIGSLQIVGTEGKIVEMSAGGMAIKAAMLTVLALLTGSQVMAQGVDIEYAADKTKGGKFYYAERTKDESSGETVLAGSKSPATASETLPFWWW